MSPGHRSRAAGVPVPQQFTLRLGPDGTAEASVATVDLQAELDLPAGAFPPRPGQDEVAVRIEPLAPGDVEAPVGAQADVRSLGSFAVGVRAASAPANGGSGGGRSSFPWWAVGVAVAIVALAALIPLRGRRRADED